MSFYITLPSNSSLDDFPENTLTHYTTRLKTPLRLNGNYEVALAQILFPRNWKHTTDGIIILNTVLIRYLDFNRIFLMEIQQVCFIAMML